MKTIEIKPTKKWEDEKDEIAKIINDIRISIPENETRIIVKIEYIKNDHHIDHVEYHVFKNLFEANDIINEFGSTNCTYVKVYAYLNNSILTVMYRLYDCYEYSRFINCTKNDLTEEIMSLLYRKLFDTPSTITIHD